MQWDGEADCLNSGRILGDASNGISDSTATVVIAESLSPEEVLALLRSSSVKGVVVRRGSLVDHNAVLLNGKGVQLAIAPGLPSVLQSTPILIDGENGRVFIHSDLNALRSRLAVLNAVETEDLRHGPPAYEGEQLSVHVDGKAADELALGIRNGATGVGILRTEWFGWDKTAAPTTEAHFAFFSSAADAAEPYGLNLRLFDLGGDKIPKWATTAHTPLQSP